MSFHLLISLNYETDEVNSNTNLLATLNNISDEMQMYQSL